MTEESGTPGSAGLIHTQQHDSPTSNHDIQDLQALELLMEIRQHRNQLKFKAQEIQFLKKTLSLLESEKQSTLNQMVALKHDQEYISSRHRAECKVYSEKIAELENLMTDITHANQSLKKISQEKDFRIKTLDKKASQVQHELEYVQGQVKQILTATSEASVKISQLEKALRKCKAEKKQLTDSNEQLMIHNESLRQELQLKRNEALKHKKYHQILTKRNSEQQARTDQLSRMLENKNKELERITNEWQKLKAEHSRTHKVLTQRQRLLDEFREEKKELHSKLQKELQKLKKEFESKATQAREACIRCRKNERLQQNLNKNKQTVKVLGKFLSLTSAVEPDQLKNIGQSTDFAELYHGIKNMLEKIIHLEGQLSNLRVELNKEKSSTEILGQENVQLRQALKESEKSRASEIQKVRQKLGNLFRETDYKTNQLKSQIQQSKSTIQHLKLDNHRLQEELVQLRAKKTSRQEASPEEMSFINHQNSILKMKLLETYNIIQMLTQLFIRFMFSVDILQYKLAYFKPFEKLYWKNRRAIHQGLRVLGLGEQKPKHSETRSKLRSVVCSLVFLQRVQKQRRRSIMRDSKIPFSQLSRQIADCKLASILSKYSQFKNQLQNKSLNQLKHSNEYFKKNQFRWVVELLYHERMNYNAIQSVYPESRDMFLLSPTAFILIQINIQKRWSQLQSRLDSVILQQSRKQSNHNSQIAPVKSQRLLCSDPRRQSYGHNKTQQYFAIRDQTYTLDCEDLRNHESEIVGPTNQSIEYLKKELHEAMCVSQMGSPRRQAGIIKSTRKISQGVAQW